MESDAVQRTLDYYDDHADEFIERTAGVDMNHVYEPFLELVPARGHILDAGCGSGRDAAEFARRGYRVTAFDGSPKLVKAATARTGLPILHLTFDAVSWRDEFDGVWASGSLLHLPKHDIPAALTRLTAALKSRGVLFASLKAGIYEGERDGRWFTDTTPEQLTSMLNEVPEVQVLRIWQTDDARPERRGTRWVNALVSRGVLPRR